jgi:membrane-bound lytic murein transglycosylase B
MKHWIQAGLLSLLFFSISIFAAPTLPAKVESFIDYMVKQHHFDREKLTQIFSQVHYNEDVVNHISHPYEEKPWNLYRAHFITDQRVADGLRYWQKHEAALQYAQDHYGVPPSLIIAIIGIETNYGERIGEYSALNALSTLAFYHQSRADFFTRELVQFFLLTQEQQLPVLMVKSSYAGALGIPQFMPSTYRHYAVTYQDGKHVDLLSNNEDAIVSVANYLKLSGWHRNEPVACIFHNTKPIDTALLSTTAKPTTSINQLKSLGIQPILPVNIDHKVSIVELRSEKEREYWIAFHNFRVIMAYNPRIIYSMAIYQLSEVIQKLHDEQIARAGARTASTRTAKRSSRKIS